MALTKYQLDHLPFPYRNTPPQDHRFKQHFTLTKNGTSRTVTPEVYDGAFWWVDVETGEIIGMEVDHG